MGHNPLCQAVKLGESVTLWNCGASGRLIEIITSKYKEISSKALYGFIVPGQQVQKSMLIYTRVYKDTSALEEGAPGSQGTL